MKQVLLAATIMMGMIACNDSGNESAADANPSADTTTTISNAPDTGAGLGNSQVDTSFKAGAGQATGSAAQASQDTGTGKKQQ